MRKISDRVLNAIFELKERGYNGYIISSSSMYPALKEGDIIKILPVASEDIRIGQVVVYESDGWKTAHRVVKITGEKIVTAGDAVNEYDEPVDITSVLGIVDTPVKKPHSAVFRFFRGLFYKIKHIFNNLIRVAENGKRA